jgi:hypothetical protein
MSYEQSVDSVPLYGHLADVLSSTYSPDGTCIITAGKLKRPLQPIRLLSCDHLTHRQARTRLSKCGLQTLAGCSRCSVGTSRQVQPLLLEQKK